MWVVSALPAVAWGRGLGLKKKMAEPWLGAGFSSSGDLTHPDTTDRTVLSSTKKKAVGSGGAKRDP